MESYKPIKILGEGSFGKVYLMRQIKKRELLCIKVMKIKNLPKKEREGELGICELLRMINSNIP